MGIFDRFTSKSAQPKPAPAPAPTPTPAPMTPAAPEVEPAGSATAVKPRLAAARERLEAKDLPGAVALYEEILAEAGDRADVLVTISGDLGVHGHVEEIVQLVAPRYDAERHGPATGINLVQAYLAARDPDAAQHVLDILFALRRPELDERLYGFSNAIAELMHAGATPANAGGPGGGEPETKISLVTLSKPIWFYGLEPIADRVLPAKGGRLRRVAFAQLALPGLPEGEQTDVVPEELARLARGIPLWLGETFHFASKYAPLAAIGTLTVGGQKPRYTAFGSEWTNENFRQLVETSHEPLDYIFAGALRSKDADFELVLRVFEVKGFRERKAFVARWTPGTADAELARFQAEIRRFMEWDQAPSGITYTAPASPTAWLEFLDASLALFLVDKGVTAAESLARAVPNLSSAAAHAASNEAASLGWLTLAARARRLGVAVPDAALTDTPLVAAARSTVA